MPYHIGSIVCGKGRLGPAYPVRADVISCNGGRAAVLSSISIKEGDVGGVCIIHTMWSSYNSNSFFI